MKTTPRIIPLSKKAPPTTGGLTGGFTKSDFRKSRVTSLTAFIALFTLTTSAVFGQVIWSGGDGTGKEIGAATNWVGGVIPSTGNNDTAEWNGVPAGPLNLVYNTSVYQSGPGLNGINLYLTGSQTSPVTFNTDTAVSAFLAIGNITIDPGAGKFTLGGTDPAHRVKVIGRPNGAVHIYSNNSTTPALINEQVEWQGGGGANWTMDFSGTGDWVANNYLNQNNGPSTAIQVDGPGTLYWTPTGFLGANGIVSPLTINSGTMVLKGSHPRISNQAWTIYGTFIFDATNPPTAAQTLSGAISGSAPGMIMVTNGNLTLSSGNSTYGGDFVLAGGELFVNGAENVGVSGPLGFGGTISFTGGVLGYSVNNIFDYSARFNTNAGQAYKIDTANQNVTFTNETGLTGSGNSLTKLGAGILTLAASSTYTGPTTVSAGKLVFKGSKAGAGNITVADGAVLDVFDTGTPVAPATLALGASSGATLEFDNVNSTANAVIAATTLSATGPVTVNINSGSLAPGNDYPLFSWTSGSTPAVSLGVLNGFIGNLTTNGNTIGLHITATAYKWTGNNNNSWDLTTANNWQQNGGPVVFANGGPALLDDTASANPDIILSGVIQPSAVSFNNVNTNYSVTSSTGNVIDGSATLSKSGSGTVTLLGGANTFTGVTTISGGTLSVSTLANGGLPSDIGQSSSNAASLMLNGGTLQYTGTGATIDRSLTLGLSGGTIDNSGTGALAFNNTGALGYSGNGPRTFTLSGSEPDDNLFAPVLANNGGASALVKNGTGKWILTGNNTYSGLTTINNGVLQVGNGGASGSLGTGNVTDNARLDINRSGSLTIGGAISGSGSLTNSGTGTLILTGNNSYSGGTGIGTNATIQVGNGGSSGSLNISSPIVNDGTFIFNGSGTLTLRGFGATVSGAGNVWVQKGTLQTLGGNTYAGWTRIDSGATFQPTIGNESTFTGLGICTNNGTLLFVRQDGEPAVFGMTNNIVGTGKVVKENNNFNSGWIQLAGTNTYTGGTLIAGGSIVLGDGFTPGAGSIVGPVIFTNTTSGQLNFRSLIFNRADDFVFTNDITSVVTDGSAVQDRGALRQMGPGMVTLTGNNSLPGGTIVNVGYTLQAGNGGAGGAIGTGAVTADGTLVINRSANQSLGAINGAGSFVQMGTGITTLTGSSNGIVGSLTVSNGTVVLAGSVGVAGAFGCDVNLYGGTLVSGVNGAVVTNLLQGNMIISGATVQATLNKSLAQSNSFFLLTNEVTTLAGAVTASGGTLMLTNAGPTLAAGDKFKLFSEPVINGGSITITGVNATWQNNLAVDGSITVLTAVANNPTNLTATASGNQLILSWPADHTGWHLQVQTNTLATGLSTNWVTIPGTDASNSYTNTITPANGAVFYRMVLP